MPNVAVTPIEGESLAAFSQRYAKANGSGFIQDPNGVFAKFDNAFTGNYDSARDIYNQWYNEQTAAKKAQADYEYTRLLNSTKYADEVKALRDAGLNPYAIMSGNGMSAGNMSYSASEAPKRSSNSQNKSANKGLGALAVIIAALAKALI